MVTGTPCAGNLVDSRLKELLPALPVVYVKAVPVQVYPSCDVFRGNTYTVLCVPNCVLSLNTAGRPGGLVGIHVNLLSFRSWVRSSPGEVSLFLTFVPGTIGRDFF